MPRVLVYIAVVSMLTSIAHAQSEPSNLRISEARENDVSSEMKVYEELFKKSLIVQRKEHAEAVRRLEKVDNYERLYKMITVLGEKMIDVIEASKTIIESGEYNPDDRSLPRNVTVQSAVSTTLENTALFGDILLHFPHVTHRILKTQERWNLIINWSLTFAYQTKHLLDSDTLARIRIALQELNIIERDQGYFNPYWQSADSQKGDKGAARKKKSAKKEKHKRGPQMTNIEL